MAVRRIDAIFAIEREINGHSAAERLAVRQARIVPLIAELETWMRAEHVRLSRHAETAKAIDYMLKRWPAFTRFLNDGRIMQTLAASFIGVGVVIFAALAAGVGAGTEAGLYLKTFANLGSLLPSVLLAYSIYRYRYLEIIIEESLVVVTFATVVLTVYVFGIRTIGDWMTQRYGVRPGLVEALLILALALLAAPLRGWLAQRFHKLFEREAALYK